MIKQIIPKRTHTGIFRRTNEANKKYLMEDFNNRCAYCDDLDRVFGGSKSYHVEHFAPKEKFPELIYTYDNLLYSCPYCNISKSNDWPSVSANKSVVGNKGYIDPCNEEYYKHLDRDEITGNIVYKTELGKYMYEHLKLYLKRHSLIFMIDKLMAERNKLSDFIESEEKKGKDTSKLYRILKEVDDDFFTYYGQLN